MLLNTPTTVQTDPLVIHVRLPLAVVKAVDHMAVELGMDRQHAMAFALEKGVPEAYYAAGWPRGKRLPHDD